LRYRSFPPGRGHLKIPLDSKQAVRAGLAMYAPCRPKGRLARTLSWRVVGVLGPWALPGRTGDWSPPMDDETWSALGTAWAGSGISFDGLVVHERLQASRTGFTLMLLKAGDPVAFAKLRDGDGTTIETEFRALDAMSAYGPRTFSVPSPLAVGEVMGWHYVLTTAFVPQLHRVPKAPRLDAITDEIRQGLDALERSATVDEGWEPMHGDFTPWNLRQRLDGTLFLVDWEDAGWGPPGADQVMYRATVAQLARQQATLGTASPEARRFWSDRLRLRSMNAASDRDAALREELLRLLDA